MSNIDYLILFFALGYILFRIFPMLNSGVRNKYNRVVFFLLAAISLYLRLIGLFFKDGFSRFFVLIGVLGVVLIIIVSLLNYKKI